MGHEVRRRSSAHLLVDRLDPPTLSEAATHHLFRVLRVRDGEVVTVTDGQGAWRPCVVDGCGLVPSGPVECEAERARELTVGFVVPKGDRPEWIVQKLTELGVARIILLHSARSVVRWKPERADRQRDKLRRVAVEALQQSRRVWMPVVDGPLPASSVLVSAVVAEPGGRLLACADTTIVIGPEGGWTDEELEMAAGSVRLGDGVLRVETAAVAAGVLGMSVADGASRGTG